jgi:hypothetical protein
LRVKERCPSVLTWKVLSDKKCLIKLSIFPWQSILCSFSIIHGRHVVSYALEMSRATSPRTCLASNVFFTSSCMSCKLLYVLLCLRNPFCWEER